MYSLVQTVYSCQAAVVLEVTPNLICDKCSEWLVIPLS